MTTFGPLLLNFTTLTPLLTTFAHFLVILARFQASPRRILVILARFQASRGWSRVVQERARVAQVYPALMYPARVYCPGTPPCTPAGYIPGLVHHLTLPGVCSRRAWSALKPASLGGIIYLGGERARSVPGCPRGGFKSKSGPREDLPCPECYSCSLGLQPALRHLILPARGLRAGCAKRR